MSANIVCDYHINALVTWAMGRHGLSAVSYYWNGQRRQIRGDERRVASVLYAENVRSVNSRYSQSDSAHGFAFRVVPCGLQPVQVIKACHCLAYQSCEADHWEESEAYAILNGIEASAVRSLAGYEDADWELKAPDPRAKCRAA